MHVFADLQNLPIDIKKTPESTRFAKICRNVGGFLQIFRVKLTRRYARSLFP